MSAATLLPKQFDINMLDHADEPSWIKQKRQTHWQAFQTHGLPNAKDDHWKYIDFAFLESFSLPQASRPSAVDNKWLQAFQLQPASLFLPFIDGYAQFLGTTQELIACPIQEAFLQHEALIRPYWSQMVDAKRYPFANLNAAFFTDGVFLYVPKGVSLSLPIHLLSLIQQTKSSAHLHHIIVLEEGSQLKLIEEHQAEANLSFLMNSSMNIFMGKHSTLDYCKVQSEHTGINLNYIYIQQSQNSQLQYCDFSSGGRFVRDDMKILLQEPGAICRTAGFYRLDKDGQYRDYHLDILHTASNSRSEMLYKGILDQQSRAVFNGHLYIGQGTQKNAAYQANHNLLQSKNAEIYSKPELEIYADDVQCKHGATIGQLDKDAIFYLRSRGMPEEEAVRVLLQSFAEEIITRIEHEALAKRVRAMVKR